ncbi:hypothetical protein HOC_10829 [Hyphomonas oceanitis SCH89]|uniref:Uncharacterized protein n=2 Tax=Hyphomonas oceanitis TaxID=81033 RepID=A0A059G6Z5_9PROT|nr:hypothetical protein HOC_10829 [Hyphomonas oceanitis SCH89]
MVSINRLLSEIGAPIAFRHLPFRKIPFSMYDDALERALGLGLVVGAGVDYAKMPNSQTRVRSQHVFRVVTFKSGSVHLFDDSGECSPPELNLGFEDLTKAIIAAGDGWWLIGEPASLEQVGGL